MSTYGIDYYGSVYYGSSTAVAFSAGNFIAKPYGYRSIQLTWDTPSGAWDYMRLVRNTYGFPVTADDGDLLFEAPNASSPSFYQDNGQVPQNSGLTPAHPYYYTIFVRETTHYSWQRAGDALGISVKDYGTTDLMYEYLPEILRSNIPYDTSLEATNDFLYRFLKLFAFNLDECKSQAENITNRYDVTNLNGLLIPSLMNEFGLRYEPNLGLRQSRIFLKNISYLYQKKGASDGLRDFIKAYAGYDNTVTRGKNLMLDQNDSSFEESIGSWASISNATLARHSSTDSPTVVPYIEPTAQPDFPNKQSATLQVTAVASGTVTISLSGDNPIHYGIPVSPSTQYTLSAYAKAGSSGRSVKAQIYWYDNTGTALTPATAGSNITDTTTSWTQMTTTATSPVTAAFAVPRIIITSASTSEKHYIDAVQFEQSSSATSFQDARQLEITLIANRINELLNPNFEASTDHWTVTNGTKALTTGESGETVEASGSVNVSGGAMEIYASAAGIVTLASNSMPILANNDYTFSIYCSASELVGDTKQVTAYIKWYDSSSTLISTSTGTPVTVGNAYLRPFVTDTAPSNAITAAVGITWTATGAGGELTGNEITVDAALFEKYAYVDSYFDGSNGVAELSDLFWEGGVANGARSHYYRNRFAVQSRLVSKLPDWIYYGSTFEILLAQPS